jgi:hypothetical protein
MAQIEATFDDAGDTVAKEPLQTPRRVESHSTCSHTNSQFIVKEKADEIARNREDLLERIETMNTWRKYRTSPSHAVNSSGSATETEHQAAFPKDSFRVVRLRRMSSLIIR